MVRLPLGSVTASPGAVIQRHHAVEIIQEMFETCKRVVPTAATRPVHTVKRQLFEDTQQRSISDSSAETSLYRPQHERARTAALPFNTAQPTDGK